MHKEHTMNKHDTRLVDKDDPKTSATVIREIKKTTSDATDKHETFVVTHEPINLKEKLALKKKAAAPQPQDLTDESSEVIDAEYTDKDADGLGLQ